MQKYRFSPRKLFRYSGKKIYRYLSDANALYKARKQSSALHSRGSLLIMDDLFPFLGTGFRIAEYAAYLSHWADAEVHVDTKSAVWTEYAGKQSLSALIDKYSEHNNPSHQKRIQEYNVWRQLDFSLGYNVFLNLAARFVHVYEKNNLPFIFTLYPGGGFRLNDPKSDESLKRVLGSPMFRKVITTQTVTTDYLLTKFCNVSDIEFIFGGPLPTPNKSEHLEGLRFGRSKNHLDVCFVANRYSPQGKDKGYDLFVEAARSLRDTPNIRFHVVGTLTPEDIDISDLSHSLRFYGVQPSHFFPKFYSDMDIIVSPNRAYALSQGAFDGFPTGACAEAGLRGVVVICTDPLNLNQYFTTSEIIIVNENSEEIVDHILRLRANPDELVRRSKLGREKFDTLYCSQAQITPRINLISSYLE